MFESIIEATTFKGFVSSLRDLSSGARISFTKTSISSTAVDSAQVAMIKIDAAVMNFKGDDTELLLDIPRLVTLAGGDIYLSYDDEHLYGHSGKAKYNVPILVDAAVKSMPMPNLHHPLSINISPDEFYSGVKAVSSVYSEKDSASYIIITFKNKELILTDATRCECVVTFEESDLDILTSPESDVTTKLSMDYILKYASRIKSAEGLTLHMGVDYPIKLVSESANVNVVYLIAPRIDVE